MTRLVVDASVVIKWFLPEVHGEAALRLLVSEEGFIAPDHLFAETANAVWKRVNRGEFSAEEGRDVVLRIGREVPVETIPCRKLAAAAYVIAHTYGRTVYDAMYVALAIQRKTRLITADDRLYNALVKSAEIAPHLQSLRDY